MQGTEHLVRYKLFLFFIISVVIRGQNYPEPNIDYLVRAGIWHLVVNDFPEAERHFQILEKYFPDNPLTQLSLGMLYIAEAADKGEEFDYALLNPLLDKAGENAERLLTKEQSAWNYFLAGASSGFTTYNNYLSQNYFSLIFDGISSINNFESCLQKDSSFYAANIGIGTYKYWKSDALKSYSWIPLVEDQRTEGVAQLKKGLKNYSYLQSFGMESLIWIYLHEKKYSEAYTLAKEQLEKYPNSRFFLWALAHAAKFISKEEAIEKFNLILKLYQQDSIINQVKEIEILHKTALLYEQLGEFSKALDNCERALSFTNLTQYQKNLLGNRLEKVEQLKKRLVKLLLRK